MGHTFRCIISFSLVTRNKSLFSFDKIGLSMSNRDKGTVTRTSAVLHWRERNNIRGWRGHKHGSHLSYLLMHVLYSLSNTFFAAVVLIYSFYTREQGKNRGDSRVRLGFWIALRVQLSGKWSERISQSGRALHSGYVIILCSRKASTR